ncbi:unnamed protein product [Pneumocystis jirovecii]|uniref:Mitochondrial import inner membrane translocase subunit n=1 Tax=Pneumocystis jirovecii TaxID=42068 RepID=L0PBS8_PNEJI|nr:unnamed protein product [Pneumocystis jirovecii]
MPFFGFGHSGAGASQAINPQKVSAAENELDMITDLFTSKCIPPNYTDSELNKGESVCIDRCVAKFFEVNAKIGEVCSIFQCAR